MKKIMVLTLGMLVSISAVRAEEQSDAQLRAAALVELANMQEISKKIKIDFWNQQTFEKKAAELKSKLEHAWQKRLSDHIVRLEFKDLLVEQEAKNPPACPSSCSLCSRHSISIRAKEEREYILGIIAGTLQEKTAQQA